MSMIGDIRGSPVLLMAHLGRLHIDGRSADRTGLHRRSRPGGWGACELERPGGGDLGESSAIALPTFSCPARWRAKSSRIGVTIPHDPHHGSHKSTRTTVVVPLASKVASVASTIGPRGASRP